VIAINGVLTESLAKWQPGTTEMTRRVDPWPAAAFAGLIGSPLPPPGLGDALPPLWHWFTLLDYPTLENTGADGHPLEGPFLPAIRGRRRMFAGGRLQLERPILIGADLTSRSRVTEVSVKQGRSGEMAFVTVRQELSADGVAVGVEEQDIVYRSAREGSEPAAAPRPSADQPVPEGQWRLEVPTRPVLLFRFSALTYNGHRIHYDRPYTTEIEGYPDLVIHGPLLALLALELPRVHAPREFVHEFQYRLVRPAFSPTRIVATGRPRPDDGTAEVIVGAAGAAPSLTGRVVLG